jgi:hypothetical protein
MSKYVAVGTASPGLTVGGTDLSNHVRQINVQMTAEDVDLTAMGATSREHAPGLRDDRIVITVFQDFAASSIDATLSPLVGVAAGATIIAYANGTTATSTSPKWTMVGVLLDYNPLDVEIGSASQTQITFVPAAGSSITRGTS